MSSIVKKVNTDFYMKIDTDYDLFGAGGGTDFETKYQLDGSLDFTTISDPFYEIVESISVPAQDTTSAATTSAGSKFISITATANLAAGDVFMVEGSGTASTSTVTDSVSESLSVSMLENLGDQGDINIAIRDTITGAVGGCNAVWDETTQTLTLNIEDSVTTSLEIQTELLTLSTLVDTCTGGGGTAWVMTDAVGGDDFTSTGGIDPDIYYIDRVTASPDRIYVRKEIKTAISGGSTLTQVGNTGIYRQRINISTAGDYTIYTKNSVVGMQNIATSVEIVDENLSDAQTKLDTISTDLASFGIRTTYHGFV